MGEDDPGKNELKQQIEDRSVQCRTLVEKSRELKALRLRSLGIAMPPPEPRPRDASEVLYIEKQKKKAQEENPEVSEQGVEKMLEDRWQAMKSEEREPYKHQAYVNQLKALKSRPLPPPVHWENFD